jgi:hypothetical protein
VTRIGALMSTESFTDSTLIVMLGANWSSPVVSRRASQATSVPRASAAVAARMKFRMNASKAG